MKTFPHLTVLTVLLIYTSSFAADLTPPLLANIALSTTNVDVSISDQTIVVNASFSDDLSGLASASFIFTSPSQNQQATVTFSPDKITAGNMLNGVYSNQLRLPRYAESGVWKIQSVELRDATSNVRKMSYGSLMILGIHPQFNVAGTADTTPPEFHAFSFSPVTVDANSSNRTVNFTIQVTDNLSGIADTSFTDPIFSFIFASFSSPSGRQRLPAFFNGMNRMSGNAQSGVYTNSVSLPQFCESGVWVLDVIGAGDSAGNFTYSLSGMPPVPPGFPLYLTVTGTGDVTAPILQSFNFSRTNVNASFQDQKILITARVTDNLSGLDVFGSTGSGALVSFTSPSGNQSVSGGIDWVSQTSSNGLNVVFTNSLIIPRYSETGIWLLNNVTLNDSASNQQTLSLAEVQAMGLPFSFTVEEFPKLKLSISGGLAILSWPATTEGFILQSTTSLSEAWTAVANSPLQLGSERFVVLLMTGEKKFFRLIK